jgi:hypothetical protein
MRLRAHELHTVVLQLRQVCRHKNMPKADLQSVHNDLSSTSTSSIVASILTAVTGASTATPLLVLLLLVLPRGALLVLLMPGAGLICVA